MAPHERRQFAIVPGLETMGPVLVDYKFDPVEFSDPNQVMKDTPIGGFSVLDGGVVVHKVDDFDMDTRLQTLVVYDPAADKFGEQPMYAGTDAEHKALWQPHDFLPASPERGLAFVEGLSHLPLPGNVNNRAILNAMRAGKRHMAEAVTNIGEQVAQAQRNVDSWWERLSKLEPGRPVEPRG